MQSIDCFHIWSEGRIKICGGPWVGYSRTIEFRGTNTRVHTYTHHRSRLRPGFRHVARAHVCDRRYGGRNLLIRDFERKKNVRIIHVFRAFYTFRVRPRTRCSRRYVYYVQKSTDMHYHSRELRHVLRFNEHFFFFFLDQTAYYLLYVNEYTRKLFKFFRVLKRKRNKNCWYSMTRVIFFLFHRVVF